MLKLIVLGKILWLVSILNHTVNCMFVPTHVPFMVIARGHYMPVPHMAISRVTFHAWHTTNYTRCVYSTPRENVVHANTQRDYLKFYCVATHVHTCKNVVEQYRTSVFFIKASKYPDTKN